MQYYGAVVVISYSYMQIVVQLYNNWIITYTLYDMYLYSFLQVIVTSIL